MDYLELEDFRFFSNLHFDEFWHFVKFRDFSEIFTKPSPSLPLVTVSKHPHHAPLFWSLKEPKKAIMGCCSISSFSLGRKVLTMKIRSAIDSSRRDLSNTINGFDTISAGTNPFQQYSIFSNFGAVLRLFLHEGRVCR